MPAIINSDDGVLSGSSGLKTSGANDGLLNLQTNGSTAMSVNASQQVTFNNPANLPNTFGFKNRIINGGMVIDQRNAGASVTILSTATYAVDRWQSNEITDGVMTAEQVQVAPAGFTDSLLFTTTTADASLANDQFVVTQHKIEGFNISDLGWGAAGAQTVTLSFWVRSSLTGTFGGVFQNDAQNRTYPFTYSISAANTWEQKTVTVAGDTTGTWLTTNGVGIRVVFDLGSGPNLRGTAGAWAANGVFGVTGAVSPISTLNATWQITGVQLEKGSTATSFDFRPYGTELALCQRYYSKSYNIDVVPGTASALNGGAGCSSTGTAVGSVINFFSFPVEMRATPTVTFYSANTGTAGVWRDNGSATDKAVAAYLSQGTRVGSVYNTATWSGIAAGAYGHWVASIEL